MSETPTDSDILKTDNQDTVSNSLDHEIIDKYNQNIDNLLSRLTQNESRTKEERFFWIFAIVIIVDFSLYINMENWSAPIVLTILQVLFLIALANYFGIKYFKTIVENLFNSINTK